MGRTGLGLFFFVLSPVLSAASCGDFFASLNSEPLDSILKELRKAPIPESSRNIHLSVSPLSGDPSMRLEGIFSGKGTNETFFVKDTEGKSIGVAKFARSPEEKWIFRYVENGGLGKREVLVSELDKLFDLDMVPETRFVRAQSGDLMTLQKWVDKSDKMVDPSPDEVHKMVIFDSIIGNGDRHGANWIVDTQGRLKLIDNGLAFSHHPALQHELALTVFEDANTIISPSVREKFLKVSEKDFEDTLKKYQIPGTYRSEALMRLKLVQEMLRSGADAHEIALAMKEISKKRSSSITFWKTGKWVTLIALPGGYYLFSQNEDK